MFFIKSLETARQALQNVYNTFFEKLQIDQSYFELQNRS